MRFMVIVKADKNSEAGVMPSTEMLTAMGKFQRGNGESGRHAGGRGPASDLEKRPGQICRKTAQREPRSVRRDQRSCRRLLADSGEIAGGGDRMDEACAVRRRRRNCNSADLRC